MIRLERQCVENRARTAEFSDRCDCLLPAGVRTDDDSTQLGIVGMGGIGRAFARRARALGITIVYHNRNRLSPDLEDGAEYISSLDELLSTSDVVSLNLPLNPKTKHLMGPEQFKRMKKSAVLINTARGGVVDEKALVKALENGDIAACGLDVYEHEPKIDGGLLRLAREGDPRVFLLPHVGCVFSLPPTPEDGVDLHREDAQPSKPSKPSKLLANAVADPAQLPPLQNRYRRDAEGDGGSLSSTARPRLQDGEVGVLGSRAEGTVLKTEVECDPRVSLVLPGQTCTLLYSVFQRESSSKEE